MKTVKILKIHQAFEELDKSQQDEINKHRWIESEKIGRDIGFDKASQDWLKNHFGSWKKYHWDKNLKNLK